MWMSFDSLPKGNRDENCRLRVHGLQLRFFFAMHGPVRWIKFCSCKNNCYCDLQKRNRIVRFTSMSMQFIHFDCHHIQCGMRWPPNIYLMGECGASTQFFFFFWFVGSEKLACARRRDNLKCRQKRMVEHTENVVERGWRSVRSCTFNCLRK